MALPETIKGLRSTLEDWGLNEEVMNLVNPYTWGGHEHRLALWIVKGHVRVVNPSDEVGQRRMFGDGNYWIEMNRAMRLVNNGPSIIFEERLRSMGLELVSYPPIINP